MLQLLRSAHNPIIKPNKDNWWEAISTINPGVIKDNGRIHLLYRAMGGDRISRFGYAHSRDGIKFEGFGKFPVFESDPNDLYERMGCEDPRITKVEDLFYVTYTACSVHPATYPKSNFSTAMAPWKCRVALLSTSDFKTFERHGVVIPDVDSKDAVLFPEKINGLYVMLHRIFPDIWIAFSKDLVTWFDHKVIIKTRSNHWDSLKIGAGAPPIKTKFGWLLFYHGIDHQKVYRMGLIILDLEDPTKILFRSKENIMEPQISFEKEGFVDNVVFATGVVEKDGQYLVYYGAGDTSIGLATIDKEKLFYKIEKEL